MRIAGAGSASSDSDSNNGGSGGSRDARVFGFKKGRFLGFGASRHRVVWKDGPPGEAPASVLLARHGNGGREFHLRDDEARGAACVRAMVAALDRASR